jgi:hypothetical protein
MLFFPSLVRHCTCASAKTTSITGVHDDQVCVVVRLTLSLSLCIVQNGEHAYNHLLAGALAGGCAATCTIPFDVVKTRLQTLATLPPEVPTLLPACFLLMAMLHPPTHHANRRGSATRAYCPPSGSFYRRKVLEGLRVAWVRTSQQRFRHRSNGSRCMWCICAHVVAAATARSDITLAHHHQARD